jgi:hypothetical protein
MESTDSTSPKSGVTVEVTTPHADLLEASQLLFIMNASRLGNNGFGREIFPQDLSLFALKTALRGYTLLGIGDDTFRARGWGGLTTQSQFEGLVRLDIFVVHNFLRKGIGTDIAKSLINRWVEENGNTTLFAVINPENTIGSRFFASLPPKLSPLLAAYIAPEPEGLIHKLVVSQQVKVSLED